MHRLIIPLTTLVAVAAFVAIAQSAIAVQGCPVGQTAVKSAGGHTVCIVVTSGGSGAASGSAGGGRESGGTMTCKYGGQVIPCVKNGAPWFASQGCYAEQMPDPPAGSPEWQGHKASEGHVWYCIAGPLAAIPQNTWFVGTAAAAPLADPAVLARRALGLLRLVTAQVHTAPAPPHNEVVGAETWLWIPADQWRTLSRSVSAGPTTVSVTASPDHVLWDLGDGSTKTCYSAGRPWVRGMTDAATTDCGYTYRAISAGRPDGLFHLTAALTYQVEWACSGACTTQAGTLGQVSAPAGGGQIRSVQRQTVVVN